MTTEIIYSVIVPVFNEKEVLNETYMRLTAVMQKSAGNYEIVFVDDSSNDNSFEILKGLHQKDKRIRIIKFSRNFGHQVAITAGIDYAKGKAVIIIDADLQDPPEVIPRLIEKWKEGYEVVYGERQERKGESFFKLFTASVFYRIIRKISPIDVPANVGDFRLIDRRVAESLKNIKEKNRFGTKYPIRKMLKFAFDAITSFSFFPLHIATYLGFFVSFICFIYIFFIFYWVIFTNKVITGWSSLMVAILFLGGVQLITIGIIGQYIGRIGDEVRDRPIYIVQEIIE